jgi:hypothetical protein
VESEHCPHWGFGTAPRMELKTYGNDVKRYLHYCKGLGSLIGTAISKCTYLRTEAIMLLSKQKFIKSHISGKTAKKRYIEIEGLEKKHYNVCMLFYLIQCTWFSNIGRQSLIC